MSTVVQSAAEFTKLLVRENTCTGSIDTAFVDTRLSFWLNELGFQVQAVASGGIRHVLASIGPSQPKQRIAFVGHYDTVPAGQGWSYPPHGAEEHNGVLYGRGASDMKSGDAAMVFAARELASSGIHSTIFLPGDEETSSLGLPALLKIIDYKFDYCLCGEPTSKQVLGDCIKIGRRGVLQGKIRLIGKPGHAAYADINPNIINELARVIPALTRNWQDTCCGTSTSVAITKITTDSTATNVTPRTVELVFDCRFAPSRTAEEIQSELHDRLVNLAIEFELEFTKATKPYLTDPETGIDSPQGKLIKSAINAIEEITGRSPKLTCDGGTSDARFVAWLGVPTIELGVPHGNMHGPDEFVEVKNIELLRQILVRTVEQLG